MPRGPSVCVGAFAVAGVVCGLCSGSGDQRSVVLVTADVVHQLSMMLRASSGATTSSLLVRTTRVSPVLGS